MSGRCGDFDRWLAERDDGGRREAEWREHLTGCADCREQARADELLSQALSEAPPALAPGFERRLRRRLEDRAEVALAPRRRRRTALPPSGWLALGGYGTFATVAAVVILSRLPWASLPSLPALGVAVGVAALVAPLALLDRFGLLLPPGPIQR